MSEQVPIIDVRVETGNIGAAIPSPINQDTMLLAGILSQNEIKNILGVANSWHPTSITGMRGNYTTGDRIYSYRYNFKDSNLAGVLFSRLPSFMKAEEVLSNRNFMDRNGLWEPVGVSDVFRVIKYPDTGYLVPHYDAPFEYDEDTVTLKSLVINLGGGDYPTRFLKDEQSEIPVNERDLSDKSDLAYNGEVLYTGVDITGDGIVFPHRRLHDSTPVRSDGKIIMRTDIIYRRIA